MIRIFIAGDLANLYSKVPFIDNNLVQIIKNADYSIVNLEGAEDKTDSYQGMKQQNGTIDYLKSVGFNMLLLANNHITDQGKEVLAYTIDKIKSIGLDYIGAGTSYEEANLDKEINLNGIKIGFINICEAQMFGCFNHYNRKYGYAWLLDPNLETRIAKLKKRVDKVIILPHAGLEHYSIPLPQFRELYKRFCDAGADAVIAAHPHVPQGYENYNNSLIIYSLGNFYFYKDTYSDLHNYSYSVILNIEKYKPISLNLVYHKISNHIVKKINPNESKFNIEILNSYLEQSTYNEMLPQVINTAYDKLLIPLYRMSLNGISRHDSLKRKVKNIVLYLLGKNLTHISDIEAQHTLLHLVENESYRYLLLERLNTTIKKHY